MLLRQKQAELDELRLSKERALEIQKEVTEKALGDQRERLWEEREEAIEQVVKE